MTRFKYVVQRYKTSHEIQVMEKATSLLNEMGDDGWELVAVAPVTGTGKEESLFYFKKIVSD